MFCERNFNLPRTRSTTSGQFGLLSQFPRTTVSRGPTARSSSRTTSVQTSPRCHTSSASLASSFTFCGKRLCVSAITKMRNASFEFFWFVMSHLSLLAVACLRQHTRPSTHARWIRNGFCRHRTPEKRNTMTKHSLPINGMHHVSLRVSDMDRSLAFYRDVLSFSPKTSFMLDGLRFAMLETGNDVYIELVEMKQPVQSVGE